MTTIKLLDARRGLNRKCEELFGNAKIAEAIYRFLCDGIEECEDASCQRWIPVTERLPEQDGLYLVTKSFPKSEPMIDTDYYSHFGSWHIFGIYVTAWMPIIPEPYRKETNNEL